MKGSRFGERTVRFCSYLFWPQRRPRYRLMKRIIIHPTHRKFLRLLRNRLREGKPIVIRKAELDALCKEFPLLQSATARNQLIYRLALSAQNRPLSEIQCYDDLILVNERFIKRLESEYAKVERKHLCPVLMVSILTSIIKHRKRRP